MTPAVRRAPRAFRPRLGAWSLACFCVTALACGAPANAQERGNGTTPWLSLAVPGGTAALLTAADLEPTRPRATALLDVIHVVHATPPGEDREVDARRAAVLAHLATIESRQPSARNPRDSDSVPLPLVESAWHVLVGTAGSASAPLVRAILADRQASLLYVGLCSVDEETRRYLAARPDLLQRLHAPDRAPLAAVFARSFHVRGNRIDPPGGPAAVALWEAVAGEPVTEPERFILAVLGKDDGRLALLYDAVAHMDAARQKFALGLWIDDAGRRLDRFRALYAASARGLSGWHPLVRPFARVLYDPAHLLLVARVASDGRPGPLGWRLFWRRALGDARLPARLPEGTSDVEQGGPLDAAALLDVIYDKRANYRRDVAEAWCFGERAFGAAPAESLPDVLVAVRGFERYRSLVLTLERLGIDDPAIYAAAVDRAERIAAVGDPDRAATALSLYQGALALIERTRLARTIDASIAGDLVASLARLPLAPTGDDRGSVASWLDTRFFPAVGVMAGPSAPGTSFGEADVLAAFAGRGRGPTPPLRTIDYEGTRYRLDPSGVQLAKIHAVREKQRGVSLDAALALERGVRQLSAEPGSRDLSARLASLDRVAAVLLAQSRAVPAWRGGAALSASITEVAHDLDAIRKASDPPTVQGRASRLARAADRQLGRALVSLAYAAALPNPNSTTLMGGDPSLAHDWGLAYGDADIRARSAWALPADSRDASGRWHVHGSLLALDLCLGTEALRRLSNDGLPGPPTVTDDDRQGFTEAALLANAFDYRDEDMALVSAAIWRGQLRVAAVTLDPSSLPDVMAKAALDETRRELLSWVVVHEPGRVTEFFSLAEFLRLGTESERHPALDAWGASGLSYDGRLSLQFPATQPFSTLAGRRARGLMAGLMPDLALLAAQTLDEHRLPAVLTKSVLMAATLDYVDRLRLAYADDWMTLVSSVQRTMPARMDDYLASATTAGPMVPVPGATKDKRP